MPAVIINPATNDTDYTEQYKLELCKTLQTKAEIRGCLENRAAEYNNHQYGDTIVMIIIFMIIIGTLGHIFYQVYKEDRR